MHLPQTQLYTIWYKKGGRHRGILLIFDMRLPDLDVCGTRVTYLRGKALNAEATEFISCNSENIFTGYLTIDVIYMKWE